MWSFFKRMSLLIFINLLVITTITVSLNIASHFFGIEIPEGYTGLLIFYSIIGFSGAFISLFLSKKMVKWRMGVQILDLNTQNSEERWLIDTVHKLSSAAGLKTAPEVGFYNSPEVNAFATGSSKNNSLIAVSSGLLQKMTKDEAEGVLGHEVAHIANGDMVTMTLLQGLMNTMVLFVASLIANAISSAGSSGRERRMGGGLLYFAIFMIAQMILSILGSILLNYFSRRREYRADEGGANYAGRGKMVAALRALEKSTLVEKSHPSMANLKISGSPSKFTKLLSTHPPLKDRIARLNQGQLF